MPVAKGGWPMSDTSAAITSAKRGFLRRIRGASSWTCPDCGLATHDQVAIRLGFCNRCSDFTGMCGAGRKIICPDMMSVTAWHTPCTSLGSLAWQITQGTRRQVALLCPAHDAQLRAGRASWITEALPLPKSERG
jgi:hypothetical protein